MIVSCDEIKEDQEVWYNGETLKWIEWKERFKNWEFGQLDKDQAETFKKSNKLLWNCFGEEVCRYYRDNDNINIKFKPN